MTESPRTDDHGRSRTAGATRAPARPSLVARLRTKYRWLDHLAAAGTRYKERNGDHYAAAITYYTMLALIPLIMVAFSAAGFVLFSRPELLTQLIENIRHAFPGEMGNKVVEAVQGAINRRTVVGVLGLLGALYSGLGWMTNIRDALTAQWGQDKGELPPIRTYLVDLANLMGLFVALVFSLGITALVSAFADQLLAFVGLGGVGWAGVLLTAISVLVSIGATWLVFLWVFSRLPRKPVTLRSAARGALVAALGLEVFKQLGGFYFRTITSSPAGAAFGPIIGVLVLVYFVSRFLLFVTAWMATARENMQLEPVPPPAPAVIRPVVQVRHAPGLRETAGLLGIGALLGLAARRCTHRR